MDCCGQVKMLRSDRSDWIRYTVVQCLYSRLVAHTGQLFY